MFSCEVLVNNKLKRVPTVRTVSIDKVKSNYLVAVSGKFLIGQFNMFIIYISNVLFIISSSSSPFISLTITEGFSFAFAISLRLGST